MSSNLQKDPKSDAAMNNQKYQNEVDKNKHQKLEMKDIEESKMKEMNAAEWWWSVDKPDFAEWIKNQSNTRFSPEIILDNGAIVRIIVSTTDEEFELKVGLIKLPAFLNCMALKINGAIQCKGLQIQMEIKGVMSQATRFIGR
eukprot:165934_1